MRLSIKGKKVTLNKPFRTSGGPKKFAVYVTKNEKWNSVIIVRFGDPNMEIKRDDPAATKERSVVSHNCDSPGPKMEQLPDTGHATSGDLEQRSRLTKTVGVVTVTVMTQ